MARHRAAKGATNVTSAIKNAIEITPRRVDHFVGEVKGAIQALPDAVEKVYDDFRTFAEALPGKTVEELTRLQQMYRSVEGSAAQTPGAIPAAGRSFHETVRAPLSMDAEMMAEGLGRSRSVKGCVKT